MWFASFCWKTFVSGTDSLNSFSALWFWFDILSRVNTFPILTCIYPNSACPSSSRYSSTMPFRLLRQQTLTLKPCSNIKSSTLKFLWLSQATDYLKWAQNRNNGSYIYTGYKINTDCILHIQWLIHLTHKIYRLKSLR